MKKQKTNRFSISYMQDGGIKKTDPLKKQNSLAFGNEIILPITYIGKGVHPDSKAEGYNIYYGDPSKSDTDKVFFTNEEFELKKNYRPSEDNPSYNREPYLTKYLNKTQGKLNQLVQYDNGGEHLPQYQNGMNLNNQFQQTQTDEFGNPINFKPINAPTTMTDPNSGQYFGVGKNPNYVNALDTTNNKNFQKQSGQFNNEALDFNKKTNAAVKNANTGMMGQTQDPYQFFNPYGGGDLTTKAAGLGESIAGGDPFEIGVNAVSFLGNLGRVGLGAYGGGKRKEEAMKNYFENKRDNLTGNFQPLYEEQRIGGYEFQDGGAIYPMEEPVPYEAFPTGVYEAPTQQFPTGIYQAPEVETTPTPSFDTNSARDTWVQKTGLPWSEAKKLGYTDGSAKDNKKLLSELNDPRFKKEYLRTEPIQKVTKTEAKKIIPKATPQFKKEQKIEEVVVRGKVLDGNKKAGAPFASKQAERQYYQNNDYQIRDKNVRPVWNFNQPKFTAPTLRQKYQEGGEAEMQNQGAPQEQMIQQVAQALSQGADPQEVLQQLVQMGMPQEEATQLIQGIMQQMQGAQQQQAPQQAPEQPMMENGGEYVKQLIGKKITGYKLNNQTGNYEVEFE